MVLVETDSDKNLDKRDSGREASCRNKTNGLGHESEASDTVILGKKKILPHHNEESLGTYLANERALLPPGVCMDVLHSDGDKRKIDELSDGEERAGKRDKSLKERIGRHRRGEEEQDKLIDKMIMKH